MSDRPIVLDCSAPVVEAARRMREANIGAVIVEKDKKPCGIVTDRDITVRVVAEGKDPATTHLSQVCSEELTTVSPNDDLDRAIDVMRQKAVRRVLVLDDQSNTVGILSLGDLAIERDSKSVLGQISAAPPSH